MIELKSNEYYLKDDYGSGNTANQRALDTLRDRDKSPIGTMQYPNATSTLRKSSVIHDVDSH